MIGRRLSLALAVCSLGLCADRKPAEGRASNDTLEITARAYTERPEIKQLLGYDLEDSISVVEVRLVPKSGGKLSVIRDDFMLRSDKDGQRSTPFAPTQIAGSSVLVISSTGGGGMSAQQGGPVWGPPMGGPPRRLGGDGGAAGNAGGAGQATATVDKTAKEDPLLAILKARVLQEKDTTEPVSGLLYFFLEGKHKPKDVELFYRSSAGKLSLRFKTTSPP